MDTKEVSQIIFDTLVELGAIRPAAYPANRTVVYIDDILKEHIADIVDRSPSDNVMRSSEGRAKYVDTALRQAFDLKNAEGKARGEFLYYLGLAFVSALLDIASAIRYVGERIDNHG